MLRFSAFTTGRTTLGQQSCVAELQRPNTHSILEFGQGRGKRKCSERYSSLYGSGCPSIRPSAVQPDAEHARGKRMTTYVYDYPSGSTASFYIDGDYVYPMSGTQPAFWINGEYWYPNPPTGTPAFSVSGKYVYEHPASSKPRYYLG